MSGGNGGGEERFGEIRAAIATKVRGRREELEEAMVLRIAEAVPSESSAGDRIYRESVLETIGEVLAFALEGIERGPGWSGPVPAAALAQARLAAQTGVGVGILLRRYVIGHGAIGEFAIREVEAFGLMDRGSVLSHMWRTQEAVLERLTAAVEHEYHQESLRLSSSPDRRRVKIVMDALSGTASPGDHAELGYDLHSSWHVSLVAKGADVHSLLVSLEARFDRQVLAIDVNGAVWAWLGSRRSADECEIDRLPIAGGRVALGIGEAGFGIDGWRLTHDQARAALALAVRRSERSARYAEDRLLAAALENETLARSLRQKYLLPLNSQSDGGAKLRRTLRAYIDLECNASSASQVLQVGRRTVKSRIYTAERMIGCLLPECLAELDVALRLGELDTSVDVVPEVA